MEPDGTESTTVGLAHTQTLATNSSGSPFDSGVSYSVSARLSTSPLLERRRRPYIVFRNRFLCGFMFVYIYIYIYIYISVKMAAPWGSST